MDMQHLKSLFENVVTQYKNRTAVSAPDNTLTYQQLNEAANKLANQLIMDGVKPDMRVGVCIERSSSLIVAILAVVKAGAVYVPIDDKSPKDRISHILSHSDLAVVLTSKSSEALVASHQEVKLVEDVLKNSDLSTENPSAAHSVDAIAYIIYTSGTTGVPNGVQVTHKNLVRLFTSSASDFNFSEQDTWTLFHSIGFDFSVWEMWGALLFGGKLVVVPYWTCREPKKFNELLIKEQVTVLNQTPSAFKGLVNLATEKVQMPTTLKYVIFGGEALEKNSLREWVNQFGVDSPNLINMYGITETTVHVTYYKLGFSDFFNDRNIIGHPLSDLKMHLLKDGLSPVADGEVGEIYVEGEGVSLGYINNESLTQKRFVDVPGIGARLYKTGDLAKLADDGQYEYFGRCDLQVKLRGFRIELGEIESHLSLTAGVENACVDVVGEGDEKQLVAFIVSKKDIDANKLKAELRGFLPEYMIPALFVMVNAIPLNHNGKVDRKKLLNDYAEGVGSVALFQDDSESNNAPTQSASLIAIFQQALDREAISESDNFLDIGGNSLVAVKVLNEIKTKFGHEISMLSLFESTIGELMAEIAPEQAIAQQSVNSAEQQFIQVVEQCLGVNNPDLSSGFLDIGGNSLVAVKLLAELERTFGQKVSMLELFENTLGEVLAQLAPANSQFASSNDVQDKLLDIFKQTIGCQSVSLSDNFLDIGGNSLLAVKVLNEIQSEFDYSLSMMSLFENTMEQTLNEIQASEGVDSKKRDIQALFDVVKRNLNGKTVRPEDNFLDLGGNSLIAVKLLADLQEEFETKVSMQSLFENAMEQIFVEIQ